MLLFKTIFQKKTEEDYSNSEKKCIGKGNKIS